MKLRTAAASGCATPGVCEAADTARHSPFKQGLTLVHFSAQPTGSECPSNSDFDILRSSLFRMGKMGGVSRNGTPRTHHLPFRPDIRTSYNSRIRSPFDESQLPKSCH